MSTRQFAFAAALLLTSACDSAERGLAPAPLPPVDSAGGVGGFPPVEPAGPIKRRVMMRSPMGGPAGNLLVDGGFEFSIEPEGFNSQTGWVGFGNAGQQSLRAETGGLCHSGLRCLVLPSGIFLYGKGVAANGRAMLGAIHAKPPEGATCDVIQPALVPCDFGGLSLALEPTTASPGEDGWCRYEGGAFQSETAMCMTVDTRMTPGQSALVDSAVLAPNDGTVPLRALAPESAARAKRTRAAVDFIRSRQRFGRPLPKRGTASSSMGLGKR